MLILAVQHGIEFASVGGDPAELMQMCVDNGMFTVSFLKEGINKVCPVPLFLTC